MGKAEVDIDIKADPDQVWAVVGAFGELDKWLPGVESCTQEGGDRHLEMMNMNITEHLVKKDDAGTTKKTTVHHKSHKKSTKKDGSKMETKTDSTKSTTTEAAPKTN